MPFGPHLNDGFIFLCRFIAAVKNQFNGYHPYRNFVNPLNPNQRCKRILLDKCKLMNSKMRPQLLTFENAATLTSITFSSTSSASSVYAGGSLLDTFSPDVSHLNILGRSPKKRIPNTFLIDQSLTTNCEVITQWTDAFLIWNPQE